jgi:hypothetical protein
MNTDRFQIDYRETLTQVTLNPDTLISSLSKIGGFITILTTFSVLVLFPLNSKVWEMDILLLYKNRKEILTERGILMTEEEKLRK